MNVRPIVMMEEMVKVLRDEYQVDAMQNTRKEAIVISRAALFNVCRGYYSATQIGQFFGKNHATILHHFKNHESFMRLPQYVEMYERLMEVLSEYDDRARHAKKERQLRKEQINELLIIVDELKSENESLREKLDAYV
jgi:cell shape-determining protein MreC